jgi:hypothetical protein
MATTATPDLPDNPDERRAHVYQHLGNWLQRELDQERGELTASEAADAELTKDGQQRALDNDKWVGKPPLGFTTDDDGYLIANVELYEAWNPDRDGFYAIEAAMERLAADRDASYNTVAGELRCSRPALTNAWKDEQKRAWYLDREADDDRVAAALGEL